jgi:hypothetical protein
VWVAATVLPTLFVPFQVSRYSYVPLVGVAMVVGLMATDIPVWARRRGVRAAVPVAATVYALYLAHATWGVLLEEADYQVIADMHRQAAASFQREIVDKIPTEPRMLTIFVRGDTMVWAETLRSRYSRWPWYWPTTYKWVYRRPHGVLGLTNTFGFVTYCLDGQREPPLFIAVNRREYERAIADGDFVVVAHDAESNSFHFVSETERREVTTAATSSDLYRYLQPGRLDSTASGRQNLER